jgi:hypothetical protein
MHHISTPCKPTTATSKLTKTDTGFTIGESGLVNYPRKHITSDYQNQVDKQVTTKEYFFIKQMPSIAKIAGALEMPRKSFLYLLLI